MTPDYPPSMKYAMRYNQLGFVPQFQSGFVDIPAIKSYVESQQQNVATYPAPTGGTDIAIPNTTMPSASTDNSKMWYWAAVIAGGLIIYYAIK